MYHSFNARIFGLIKRLKLKLEQMISIYFPVSKYFKVDPLSNCNFMNAVEWRNRQKNKDFRRAQTMEGIEWNKRQKNKDLSNNLKEIKQWKAKTLLPPINLLL